jgi:hypothetical protein
MADPFATAAVQSPTAMSSASKSSYTPPSRRPHTVESMALYNPMGGVTAHNAAHVQQCGDHHPQYPRATARGAPRPDQHATS